MAHRQQQRPSNRPGNRLIRMGLRHGGGLVVLVQARSLLVSHKF
jgi:hypothetical protein